MENDLNVSIQGFSNKELANTIGKTTLNIIDALYKKYNLDISKLKKVLISSDYSSALTQVSDDYNHCISSTYTNSAQAVGIAQLLTKLASKEQIAEYTLVLSANFFFDIILPDETVNLKNLSPVIHRLHHELIHVHERNVSSLDQKKTVDDYDDALFMPGIRAWSEYLANYESSETAPDESVKETLNTLEATLTEVPSEIEDLIFKYKIQTLALGDMYFEVKKRIKLITNMYAYAHGYIHAWDIDMDKHFPKLTQLLSSSKLAKPLSNLDAALIYLKTKYDCNELVSWEDFDSTTLATNELYAAFGIRIERNKEPDTGIYIHVD
ncbi:hypothetical protein [Shewanella sp. WPAGA9]|uniref:hypothetical protein n=1 Tax=Shewanella sp. ENK2 TaxID=2775245 RepID=UPI00177B4AF0|nr:hypothetical protein [Shewanella sp. WPAGA9]